MALPVEDATLSFKYRIGIDIGGTFTDVVVSDEEGNIYTQKAFTTKNDYSEGIFNALHKVCESDLRIPLEALLGQTGVFVNGTTIVTNALAELKGLRVGLITTAGFKDTLRIARSARTNEWNMQTQVPPPEIVKRDCIVEVYERIDYAGDVVLPLDTDHARKQIRYLVEEKHVEAIAICLLWSFRNPSHEKIIQTMVQEMYPHLFVSVSSEIYPVAREYERMVTTVLNAFTSQGAAAYIDNLEARLKKEGLRVPVGMMQSIGGITSTPEARKKPISLLNSGPVGGVIASNALAKNLGLKNVICADLGGTSFDTSLISDNQITYIHRAQINRLETGLSLVDISAIGAGGGSIAWIDERGIPQVGPQSAGSSPGPACYGRGGKEPTVTDVAVALGFIDPDYFLGGEVKLDKTAAIEAIEQKIAIPLGIGVMDAAAGLYDLLTASMSHAVRAVSIEKGYDPREFTMIAYGGASALYIAEICRELGISQVVVPKTAAVFSAYGLLQSDYSRSYVQTVNWNLALGSLDELNATYDKLRRQAVQDLVNNGFRREDIQVVLQGDFKFGTQAFELTIPVSGHPLHENDRQAMAEAFQREYERLYGEGTSWEGAENMTVLLNCRAVGIVQVKKPKMVPSVMEEAAAARSSQRNVFLPQTKQWKTIDIYDSRKMKPGVHFRGPAVIEAPDTTIYVPDGAGCRVDVYGNYVLSLREG